MTKNTGYKSISKQAIGDWLDTENWDLWTTLSTGYELTLPAARRSMVRFHDKLSSNNQVKLFWASEKFDVKDGFHVHALLKFSTKIYERSMYRDFVNNWRDVCNTRNANVYSERYKTSMGAHKYISKYITKSITDYDYFDTNLINRETINNNIQKFNEIGRNIKARKQIEKMCKQVGGNYTDLKKDYYEELNENKKWYEDIHRQQVFNSIGEVITLNDTNIKSFNRIAIFDEFMKANYNL